MILRILTKPPVLLLIAILLAAGAVFFLYQADNIGTGIGSGVEIPDYHEVGKKYAALYLFRGSAVFSVDLSKASISKTADGEVIILLPEPTAVVNINDSETELLAEYQRTFFNGSADDGFQAYLNSLRLVDQIALEKVSNYQMLMDMAKASARKQVMMLSQNVCINCSRITVLFRTES